MNFKDVLKKGKTLETFMVFKVSLCTFVLVYERKNFRKSNRIIFNTWF